MKTKLILFSALMGISFYQAQEKPYSDIHMRNYSRKVDSIIISEKAKMNDELDLLEKSFKDQKLSYDDKQKQKADVAKKYEQSINEKVDEQKNQLEEATRELVKASVMGKTNVFDQIQFAQNNAVLSIKDSKKTKKELLKGVDLNVSFALSNLVGSVGSFNIGQKTPESQFGKSGSFVVEYRYTNQLGKLTSPVFYRIGLGVRSDTYVQRDPQFFVQSNRQIFLEDFTDGSLRKARLSNNYIHVPVDFVFVLNPKYTVENDQKMLDNSKGNLRISAGIYGGVRFLSQNQIIYKNFEDNRVSNRENIKGSVNDFIFGGKISLGYGALNLFVKKDFTPIFNNNALIENKYGIQIGLELLYINF